ncbi:ribose ABC transporter substrate-binding protein RbsB [Peptoniphilus indolicus]|uniref:Ribose ABC superfamily ATP binding cassette transporter, binding protein n=2 Tax=Peptoniphilus indolicus TaxID=33030 RepID=G4D6T5_9FIRM|nr:ribose ABC transporter substrate-binding protein RbsB [Peptoniphilus indolicus]EGY76386.1 ribose ABC superfamily ATP binding cassette transporter, binding protein [Peptoniphilus indolicus ATCC 29427]SUB76084.1 D-ribose-binding periplasmic protein precursor [Peptoniphilus indolicus]
MNKKIIAMLMSALIVATLLAGCNGGKNASDKKDEAAKDSKTIGVVVSTLQNPFFVDLKTGAEEKAKELGVEIIALDSQDDPAKELSNVEDLITKNVDVLLINPTDSDAVAAAVMKANEAGIPVITLDRASNGGEVVSHIASDNIAGGKMAGEHIIKLLEGKGNVVELEGIPGSSSARERGQGFNEAIEGSELTVVAKQTANYDRTEGLSVMENILQANSDIQAVFAHNDEMALGALEAIKTSGKDIKVVGFDATDDAVKSVEAGELAATIAQQPKEIGSLGIETAVKVVNGETVEKSIPVELKLVVK